MVTFVYATEKLKWEYAMTTGNPPSPRDSHTCSSWKNRIIVLGGEDSSDCYLSDVHILDTGSLSFLSESLDSLIHSLISPLLLKTCPDCF